MTSLRFDSARIDVRDMDVAAAFGLQINAFELLGADGKTLNDLTHESIVVALNNHGMRHSPEVPSRSL